MPPERRRPTRACAIRFKPYYGRSPAGPTVQIKYFYRSTGEQAPIYNPGHDSSPGAYPIRIRALHSTDSKWHGAPRPANYLGPWPPENALQLMSLQSPLDTASDTKANQLIKTHGKPTIHECLGKFCWQTVSFPNGFLCQEETCDHTLTEWLTGTERWEDRFELRCIANMGVGLHSKQDWNKDDILGAYLGELIPKRNSNPDYCHEVFIGPEFTKTKASTACIDAEHFGNYTRFCNHSCENNAVIAEQRVGRERVLALTAVRSIAAGEQVTIDYGEEYFRLRKCLCGSPKCRYPNDGNFGDSTKGSKSGGSKETSQLLEESIAVPYDSVSATDSVMETG